LLNLYKPGKLKERTEDELSAQAKGLGELCSVLEKNEITYFLSGGTLLGMIREGDFIKWDWDVEIAVMTEEIIPKRKQLLIQLEESGFQLHSKNYRASNFKLNLMKYDTRYEILGYVMKDGFRQRMRSKMPARFFTKGCLKELRGKAYQVLSPPEEYLEYNYGDWKTPVKSKDRSVYTTDKSRNRMTLKERIKNFFGLG